MRFYQSLKGPLKIYEVDGVWVIGIKHKSVGGTVVHNCVHNDNYVYITYPTAEAARQAAETIMELRKVPLVNRIEVG